VPGKTGEIVDGTSVVDIAHAINELLDHPSRLRAMGAAGREWAEQRWSWQIWGERFEELLLGDEVIS
jgi:phosphatidylinositol alpha-1,6-mannosyltransferase